MSKFIEKCEKLFDNVDRNALMYIGIFNQNI